MNTINATSHTVYVVMTSAAKMPSSCWGRYGNVGIMSVAPGAPMPRIMRESKTASVVWYRGKLNKGSSSRCAFEQALTEATAKAAELNAAASTAQAA